MIKRAFHNGLHFITLLGILSASNIHVRNNDPVYSFLERMAVYGILTGYNDNTLPLTRDYIAQQLVELNDQRDKLAGVDQRLLNEYIVDYRYELTVQKHESLSNGNNTFFTLSSRPNIRQGFHDLFSYQENLEDRHIVVHETPNEMLWVDIDEMVRLEFKDDLGRFITQNAIRISSQIGDYFAIYSDAYIYDQQLREGFMDLPREYKGGALPVEKRGLGYTSSAFDYSSAYMSYSSNLGDWELGLEPIIWGNTRRSLILSDNVDPFAFISWQKHYGKSKFSFLHGYIKPAEATLANSVGSTSAYIQKYIVGHRWDINVSRKFHFAFSEILIYGDRDPELAFFIPILFLWPVQHSLTENNDDNILWIFDSEYYLLSNMKFYGTFLIDNITSAELFKNSMENTFGIQSGWYYAPKKILALPVATDFRIEFTALRPWVYAHRAPLKSSYTHNGRPLGFYAGPNSQLLFLENRWELTTRQSVNLSFSQLKHGINTTDPESAGYYPIGDNPNQNYLERNHEFDNATKWLMGKIITTKEFSVTWLYKLSNIIALEFNYSLRSESQNPIHYYSLQIRFDY